MVAPDRQVHTHVDGSVATLTLSRPEALNAITREMLEQLSAALDAVSADPAVAVVVLTGAGRAFSAGVDLKALGGRSLEGGSVGEYLDAPARAVIDRLTTIPQVVVARVNGFCFTGALELVLACDLVVVACDLVVVALEATLADTHTTWGLRPTWGMSQRLPRAVGMARARELSYTARRFSGAEALEWGLAVRAVPLADLDAAVAELAGTVSANSGGSVAAYKDLYRHALDVGQSEGLGYEGTSTYPIEDTASRLASFR